MRDLLVFTTAAIVLALAITLISIWVYKDAKQRGLPAGMWVLVVLLSGSFIGLILYLLIGRRQGSRACEHCGAATDARGAFCSACGERIAERPQSIKSNRGLVVACAVCIVLALVIVLQWFSFASVSDGFAFQKQYSLFWWGTNGSIKNESQTSAGNTWELSFDKASEGYSFQKTYNAASQPESLSIEVRCEGSVRIVVAQNEISIDEIIREGSVSLDLSAFETGKISMQIICIDALDFVGRFEVIHEREAG